jgi:hypothetical protein
MRIAALGLLGTAAFLIDIGSAEAVEAASAPFLSLDLGSCSVVPVGEVQSLVAIELRRPVVLQQATPTPTPTPTPAPAEPSATTAVRVTCQGLRAEITIDDPLTGKTVGRVVDLGAAAPVARPHLLALSIVELLAASWIELASNPRPSQPPVAGATTPAAREAALELVSHRPGGGGRRAPRLLAALAAQTSTAGLRSWGGAIVAAGHAGVHLGWMADLAFQHGERTFTLGRVTADTVSGLGALLGGVSWGGTGVRGGLGVRGGEAWVSGAPADPTTAVGGAVRGFWWGPVAVVDVSLTLRGRFVLALTFEAGRVILPVVATVQGADPVAIDGTWVRGALGVGFTY